MCDLELQKLHEKNGRHVVLPLNITQLKNSHRDTLDVAFDPPLTLLTAQDLSALPLPLRSLAQAYGALEEVRKGWLAH